jgi:putative endonuclease
MASDSRRARGQRGEELAAAHLVRAGYRIVDRNVRLQSGELDLLALDGDTLCFVEVRLRSGHGFGSAEESVDARKQRRLARVARELLATRPRRLPRFARLRFDVVAIDASREPPVLRLVRDAFVLD